MLAMLPVAPISIFVILIEDIESLSVFFLADKRIQKQQDSHVSDDWLKSLVRIALLIAIWARAMNIPINGILLLNVCSTLILQ
jgi:hypothetical protein